MIKNFLNNLLLSILQRIPYVQKLEEDLKKALVGEPTIVSIHMEDGKLNATLKTKITLLIAEWAMEILKDYPEAENYIEFPFGVDPDLSVCVGAIRIQKHSGKSPHQLRMIAEAERDEAIAAMNKAIAEKEQLELMNLGIEYEDTDVPRGRKKC
jgi:hypothetical protein